MTATFVCYSMYPKTKRQRYAKYQKCPESRLFITTQNSPAQPHPSQSPPSHTSPQHPS